MRKGLLGLAICAVATGAAAAELAVDFSKDGGRLKPEIHSSGWTPRVLYRINGNSDDAIVRAMNMTYTRTHDWALVNPGQKVVDYQYIFPLFDKDAKDPSNYDFGPTDHILNLARNVGLKIFYRLGTSIEHTGWETHFNARVPKDYDKTAEIFAATVRHYNRGWANGFNWGIKYWEIWNEPDGLANMWWLPEAEGGRDKEAMWERFIRFYITVHKRLKGEFPDIKVGGPALCSFTYPYVRPFLKACKEAGIRPDFFSWHYYGDDPDRLMETVRMSRETCDEYGFKETELILNEYHYSKAWDGGVNSRSSSPATCHRSFDGPTGHNNIDAACFYLTAVSLFQTSPLAQAYYYGSSEKGPWGYRNEYQEFNKPYYAACLYGKVIRDYPRLCEVRYEKPYVTLAVKSEDGKKGALLVVDYRGSDQVLTVRLDGMPAVRRTSAVVLDNLRDSLPVNVNVEDGEMTLVKADGNSAAFLVKFDFE